MGRRSEGLEPEAWLFSMKGTNKNKYIIFVFICFFTCIFISHKIAGTMYRHINIWPGFYSYARHLLGLPW